MTSGTPWPRILRMMITMGLVGGLLGCSVGKAKPDDKQPKPPSGAMGPCEVPPVWDDKFAGNERFVPALDGSAYCDQETGLVWEASPDTGRMTWYDALAHCLTREVDGRKGWHLPLVEQLTSLVDTHSNLCNGGGSCLPDGHPFQGVSTSNYWSATIDSNTPRDAWAVVFFKGNVFTFVKDMEPSVVRAWCVRGGQSFDGNTHSS